MVWTQRSTFQSCSGGEQEVDDLWPLPVDAVRGFGLFREGFCLQWCMMCGPSSSPYFSFRFVLWDTIYTVGHSLLCTRIKVTKTSCSRPLNHEVKFHGTLPIRCWCFFICTWIIMLLSVDELKACWILSLSRLERFPSSLKNSEAQLKSRTTGISGRFTPPDNQRRALLRDLGRYRCSVQIIWWCESCFTRSGEVMHRSIWHDSRNKYPAVCDAPLFSNLLVWECLRLKRRLSLKFLHTCVMHPKFKIWILNSKSGFNFS